MRIVVFVILVVFLFCAVIAFALFYKNKATYQKFCTDRRGIVYNNLLAFVFHVILVLLSLPVLALLVSQDKSNPYLVPFVCVYTVVCLAAYWFFGMFFLLPVKKKRKQHGTSAKLPNDTIEHDETTATPEPASDVCSSLPLADGSSEQLEEQSTQTANLNLDLVDDNFPSDTILVKPQKVPLGRNAFRQLGSVCGISLILLVATVCFMTVGKQYSDFLFALHLPFFPLVSILSNRNTKQYLDLLFLCFSILPSLFLWFGLLLQSYFKK